MATTRRRATHCSLLVTAALALGACGDDDGGGGAAGSTVPEGRLADVAVTLTPVAEVPEPVAATTRPGDASLFVAGKEGVVVEITPGDATPRPVLDVRERVLVTAEQGLLGLAFSPDGAWLYVHLSEAPSGDGVVVAYPYVDGAADPDRPHEIIRVAQPTEYHNGGELRFGPDGMLYLALGDGSAGGDPDYQAQQLNTWLGKILRIDPRPGDDPAYEVPPDNPFVDDPDALGEVWAYGLRNPWRISFDTATGDLWVGDVGQSAWEEVSFGAAGEAGWNFGWNRLEGTHVFNTGPPPGHTPPVFEYARTGGDGYCSVVGGYVYRGTRIPDLEGAYLFGDHCEGTVRALRLVDGEVVEASDLPITVEGTTSFAQDAAGELYVLGLGGTVHRIDPAA